MPWMEDGDPKGDDARTCAFILPKVAMILFESARKVLLDGLEGFR